jgi:hypothetical protein
MNLPMCIRHSPSGINGSNLNSRKFTGGPQGTSRNLLPKVFGKLRVTKSYGAQIKKLERQNLLFKGKTAGSYEERDLFRAAMEGCRASPWKAALPWKQGLPHINPCQTAPHLLGFRVKTCSESLILKA